MPYPNFHACRLHDPGGYSKFRYKKQGGADIILGMKKGGGWEIQAIRYPKELFGEAEARSSCSNHGGSFELPMSAVAAGGPKEHTDAEFWMGKAIQEWPEEEELPKCYTELELEQEGDAKKKMEEIKTYAQSMRGVEIFSSGVWNGDEYSDSDIDAMVSAFYSVGLKPPLKLGHDEAQKWFGQRDGAPALGWLENVRRVGKKLVADIIDIPDTIYHMIVNKQYRTKSAEVYWNYKDAEGRIWPRVLKAVALLGADLPAVTNLQDLQVALMADGTRDFRTYEKAGNVKVYIDEQYDGGGYTMDQKVFEETITSLRSQLEAAHASRADWEDRAIRAEAKLAKKDEDIAVKEFKDVTLQQLKKEGKILPAEEESLIISFSAIGPGTKRYGDRDVNPREMFVKSLQDRKPQVKFNDTSGGGEDGDADKPPAVAVDERIREFIKNGQAKDYQEGKELVKTRFPEVWKRYISRV